MADRDRIGYLPGQLADELRRWAPPELTDDDAWKLRRLAGAIYAHAYDEGHVAGYEEGYRSSKRPTTNDVARLREALAAEVGGDRA